MVRWNLRPSIQIAEMQARIAQADLWLFFPRDWTMALYMLPELGPSAWDLLSAGFVRPCGRKNRPVSLLLSREGKAFEPFLREPDLPSMP
jgi:hypothetical protein